MTFVLTIGVTIGVACGIAAIITISAINVILKRKQQQQNSGQENMLTPDIHLSNAADAVQDQESNRVAQDYENLAPKSLAVKKKERTSLVYENIESQEGGAGIGPGQEDRSQTYTKLIAEQTYLPYTGLEFPKEDNEYASLHVYENINK